MGANNQLYPSDLTDREWEYIKGNYSLDSHGALPNHDFLATQSRQNLYG
jgi:hypothetical protein